VREVAGASVDGRFSLADYRARAEMGRNFAIELLEYFDAAGLTERIGEGRRLRA
jgi:hypothetical protein